MALNIFDEAEQIHRDDLARALVASPKLARKATVIEACRFVKEHGFTRFRGTLLDSFTASAILAVHDSPHLIAENRAKFVAIDDGKRTGLVKMSRVAFKLVK